MKDFWNFLNAGSFLNSFNPDQNLSSSAFIKNNYTPKYLKLSLNDGMTHE